MPFYDVTYKKMSARFLPICIFKVFIDNMDLRIENE